MPRETFCIWLFKTMNKSKKIRKQREDSTHHMWSHDDEERLKAGVLMYGKNWDLVKSQFFQEAEDVTASKCQQHWNQMKGMCVVPLTYL